MGGVAPMNKSMENMDRVTQVTNYGRVKLSHESMWNIEMRGVTKSVQLGKVQQTFS